MKRVWTIALSAVLAGTMACTAWAADVPSNIGVVSGELPAAFQGKEAMLEENCKKAYEWAQQLHAKEAEDGGFRFGQSTDQLLHYTDVLQSEISKDVLLQDFDGGNSTSRDAFRFHNWAALICTDPETCEILILRDAPAEYIAKGGGKSTRGIGMPVSNQYWRMEGDTPVLYQQFEDGYLRVENGQVWYAEFFSKTDLGDNYADPPRPPTAYGPIDEPSPDGCTWENPLYIGWNAEPEPASSDAGDSMDSGSQTSSVISDPGPEAFIYEAVSDDSTSTNTATAGRATTSAPAESASVPVEQTSDTSSHPESQASGDLGANAATSDTGGWNAGLAAGITAAVTVMAGGVFCLYWFVLRGKKAAQPSEGQPSGAPDKEDKTE